MNKAESESIHLQLKQLSLEPALQEDDADLVILNTCSVRKTAEDRIWGRIGHFKHKKNNHPNRTLIVLGCMAERLKEDLLADGVVDIVIGNFEKNRIGEILSEFYKSSQQHSHTRDLPFQFFSRHSVADGGFKAYLPIMHGCNNWCAYCIVPHVRGREVSRNPEDIFHEIAVLERQGIVEITLLGQNVNSYQFLAAGSEKWTESAAVAGPDHAAMGPNTRLEFPELLRQITARIQNIEWIRFMTSHPKDLSDDLIRVIAAQPKLCKHIHLPVQHGSDKILKAMGRGYGREQYLALVHKLRTQIPDISISSDLLIGFPGEEAEDFQATLDLMAEVKFTDAFTYRYNPREGTRAFLMEDTVPEALKLERLGHVIDLQHKISRQLKHQQLGRVKRVLVEAESKKNKNELLARTESDDMVVFPGDQTKIGCFTRIKLVSLKGNTFQGREE